MSKSYGFDGLVRSAETDRKINAAMDGAMNSAAGKEAMMYLESITIRVAMGPLVSNDQLRHLEGARWLVSIMKMRAAQGREQASTVVSVDVQTDEQEFSSYADR